MAHSIRDIIRVPKWLPAIGGRVIAYTPDPGDAISTLRFKSHLEAVVRRNDPSYTGRMPDPEFLDLGSGLTTNVAAQAMANDFAWSAQLNLSTLGTQNFHAWGTGATAAAATDIALQTLAAPTTATAVTGTPSLVSAANSQIYKNSATITAGGTLTITEWGLHSLATLSSTTGSPFTATSATSWTDTGSAQTASSATVRGLQQTIVKDTTSGTAYGLNLSNTTHVGTIPAWYVVATGAAAGTPTGTDAFAILPVLLDHKVFTGIGVNNLDTITFNYSATIASGN